VGEFPRIKCASQFSGRQREREFLKRDDLLPENRMKRKLDIVGDVGIFILR
jgi:hypothetical protein